MRTRRIPEVLILFAFISGCAHMGAITGGPKDERPPVVISSKPLNYSTGFTSGKIEIEFDEYIVLKNVNQELIISPPLPKKPDVKIRNKSLVIDLKNELRDSTTYTLNFGKAIADNNEGNVLLNYEFVFSTGDFLDSLSLYGSILNSFDLQPSKDPFIIGMYDQPEDSVPLKTIPVYVGKTDAKGNFRINNIKADTFKIFALKDLNANLLFDLYNEEIAFTDTALFLTPEFLASMPVRIIPEDTLLTDTTEIRQLPKVEKKGSKKSKGTDKESVGQVITLKDTAVIDSLAQKKGLPAMFVDLLFFTEDMTKQYMTNNERISKERFQLCFNLPLKENPGINVIDYEETDNWCLTEISFKRDTFIYWLTDTTLLSKDTLKFEVRYPMTDSSGNLYTKLDTLKYITRKPVVKQTKSKKEEIITETKLTVGSLRNNGVLDLNGKLSFNLNYPLQEIDTSKIKLILKVDSIEAEQDYKIINDTINFRKIFLDAKWVGGSKYRMDLFPGAFTDIYYHTNDTLRFNFTLQEKDYYGTLIASLSGINTPVILQLMNESEVVLKEKTITTDGKVIIDFLPPSKYLIKFIYDRNGNNKWDTGNYLKKIQPEKVLYYKGEISIRSNWDFEIKQDFSEHK